MIKIESLISKIGLYFTNTGLLPLSPILSLLGACYLFFTFKIRYLYKIELSILLFLFYVFVSTVMYHPVSFFDFGYYRYDGNIWVSYLPLFFFSFSRPLISEKSIIYFIKVSLIIYLSYLLLWYMSHGFQSSFQGLFTSRNATGGFLSILTISSFVLALQGYKKFKFITFLLLIVLVSTYSRGSLFSFITVAFIVYLFYKKNLLLDRLLFALAFIATLSIAIFFYDPDLSYCDSSVRNAYTDKTSTTKEVNTLTRAVYLWPKAIDIFINNPILGSGFSSYNDYIESGHRQTFASNHAHHSYLHILAEMGLFGLMILLYFIVLFRRFWLKHRRNHMMIADISYFSFLVVVFAAFTEHRLTTPASMIIVSTLIGLFISHVRYSHRRYLKANNEKSNCP